MGNIHTTGPNEALIVSGEYIHIIIQHILQVEYYLNNTTGFLLGLRVQKLLLLLWYVYKCNKKTLLPNGNV